MRSSEDDCSPAIWYASSDIIPSDQAHCSAVRPPAVQAGSGLPMYALRGSTAGLFSCPRCFPQDNRLGNNGAIYPRKKVNEALLSGNFRDVIVVHINHPEAATGAGVRDAIPELKQRGFRFVRLSVQPLR